MTDKPPKVAQSASWRDELPVHPAADLFPLLPPDELRALGKDIVKNGLTSSIVLWRADSKGQAQLLDGRNRLDAIEIATRCPVMVGPPSVMAGNFLACDRIVTLDKSIDPWAYVVSANIHRRHLTAEQKRDLIAALLKADPSKSDRQIAETVKASHHTVGVVRTQMEGRGQLAHVEKRTDTKGRQQPVKKATTAKKPQAPHAGHERRAAQQETKAAHAIGKPKLASDGKTTLYCSFCGKSQHDVQTLFTGSVRPSTCCICNECVADDDTTGNLYISPATSTATAPAAHQHIRSERVAAGGKDGRRDDRRPHYA